MGIMEKFFGGKSVVITSAMIRDEIERTESEIASFHAKAEGAMAGLATMTDAEHVVAEADIATTKRAIARLDARVAHLTSELPKVIAAEESVAKSTADEALRQRTEAARKANTKEAAKLLADYDKLASQMGVIFERLTTIDTETTAVNEALRYNAVAENVVSYTRLHRKHPDRQATERREMRDVWVHHDGIVTEATKGEDGSFIRPRTTFDRTFGYDPQPKLDRREVVVGRTFLRPGHFELPLSEIRLPPGFFGGAAHWPRK